MYDTLSITYVMVISRCLSDNEMVFKNPETLNLPHGFAKNIQRQMIVLNVWLEVAYFNIFIATKETTSTMFQLIFIRSLHIKCTMCCTYFYKIYKI